MEILNHHLHLLASKGITDPKTAPGSTPYYVYWHSGPRWGHLYLDTCRVTEYRREIDRHVTL